MLCPTRLKYQSNPGRNRHFQNLAPLTKGYLDFCFSYSLEQLISIPTRVTNKTATLIDHVLTHSSQKVSQCGVIELGISDHNLVYWTRKTRSFKPNKHNAYLVGQWKIILKKNF